ncbi:MAG: hypothetical protein APF76_08750 [Desulfitibacter sp. BRH_c19]|nr:MAG: hypothetical protein APF76_08750 [Desulfitibacter sp. BRH_c19]
MSELRGIQDFVQDIAEAISAALDMGVEIIDSHLLRIAGTGESKEKIGTKMAMGHICRHALLCKKPFILVEPGKDQICEICHLYSNCDIIKAGFFMPIQLEGMPVGLINLVAFTDEQKIRLLNQEQTLLQYVAKMSELLSSKIAENRSTKQLRITAEFLKTIINSIDIGVIGVNAEGYIAQINQSAGDILGLPWQELRGSSINTVLSKSPLCKIILKQEIDQEQVITYQIGEKRVRVLSYFYPVYSDGILTGAFEAFYRLSDVQRKAERWAGTEYQSTLSEIIGDSEIIKDVKERVLQVAQGSSTVLIQGESGTGKELFARAIHAASPRANKPLKIINCSAIPDNLLESELFGYDEGAFTGAKHGGKIGKFELADGGTVFLDELGELPLYLQAKLLRVLQNRTIERVGGNSEIKIDVRIVAATNRDIEKMVADGQFREDLYYRLNVIPLYIPPLRARRDDISLLVDYFIYKYNEFLKKTIKTIHPEALEILKLYNWPGNVRELENAIEYACNFEQSNLIMPASLPLRILRSVKGEEIVQEKLDLKCHVREVEKKIIMKAILLHGGSLKEKELIANELGISVPSLYRKLKDYNIKLNNS